MGTAHLILGGLFVCLCVERESERARARVRGGYGGKASENADNTSAEQRLTIDSLHKQYWRSRCGSALLVGTNFATNFGLANFGEPHVLTNLSFYVGCVRCPSFLY